MLLHTIHIEATLPTTVREPAMTQENWILLENELMSTLNSHEEFANDGDRYRVGHFIHRMGPDDDIPLAIIHYDYILKRIGDRWNRTISIWRYRSPCDYDFDVHEMYPM